MARDKILTLTPEQHKLLGHALALAHAVHSQMGGNGLGVAPGELPAIYDDVDIYVQPGAHGDTHAASAVHESGYEAP